MLEILMRPECCDSEEMDCGACLRTAALNVSRVCGAIDQEGARSVFEQLYAHPFCKSKQHLFERAFATPPRKAAASLELTPALAASAA